MIRNLIWRIVAWVVSRKPIADWLINRAQRTPYSHITAPDGSGEIYMARYWLFNPYPTETSGSKGKVWSMLPSVRVHHIMQPDVDRNLHDHPWDARTIVLRGFYFERRLGRGWTTILARGHTARINFGEYHRITSVSYPAPWTLFITWKYRGTWGFLVDGVKVPWRTYLGVPKS